MPFVQAVQERLEQHCQALMPPEPRLFGCIPDANAVAVELMDKWSERQLGRVVRVCQCVSVCLCLCVCVCLCLCVCVLSA